jgi:hypothetical protein
MSVSPLSPLVPRVPLRRRQRKPVRVAAEATASLITLKLLCLDQSQVRFPVQVLLHVDYFLTLWYVFFLEQETQGQFSSRIKITKPLGREGSALRRLIRC